MSELLKKVTSELSGYKKVFPTKYVRANLTSTDVVSTRGMSVKQQIRVDVRIGTIAFVEDDAERKYVCERIMNGIREEVFGEFRATIRAIEEALFDHDINAAREGLEDMYRKMFVE